MTQHTPIPAGEEMVEIYDIRTDQMMLAPKALADRAQLLRQAWFGSIPEELRDNPNSTLGEPGLFQAAKAAALELRASMRPGNIAPEAYQP